MPHFATCHACPLYHILLDRSQSVHPHTMTFSNLLKSPSPPPHGPNIVLSIMSDIYHTVERNVLIPLCVRLTVNVTHVHNYVSIMDITRKSHRGAQSTHVPNYFTFLLNGRFGKVHNYSKNMFVRLHAMDWRHLE